MAALPNAPVLQSAAPPSAIQPNVVVGSGGIMAIVNVTTLPAGVSTAVMLSATGGGASKQAILTVTP